MSALLQAPAARARARGPSFDLNAGEVTIWRVFLDAGPYEMGEVMSVLGACELEEALGIVHPVARQRFLVARAARRVVLARYLNIRPKSLHFERGVFGKPMLRSHAAGVPLRFNQSRSAHLTLIAVACEQEVGIDLERIDPARSYPDVAGRCFSPRQVGELLRLPAHMRPAGFFERWTRLEAYVKATGRGLPDLLASGSRPGPAGDVDLDAQSGAEGWRLHTYRPAGRFVATVAVDAGTVRLHHYDWPRAWTSQPGEGVSP